MKLLGATHVLVYSSQGLRLGDFNVSPSEERGGRLCNDRASRREGKKNAGAVFGILAEVELEFCLFEIGKNGCKAS